MRHIQPASHVKPMPIRACEEEEPFDFMSAINDFICQALPDKEKCD
ncbi:MAG: hypothetical protein GY851_23570 [bacterium]|nr:hypothetical protein [bacterium]